MTNANITDVVRVVLEALTPLPTEDRKRVIQATLTLLGDTSINSSSGTKNETDESDEEIPSIPGRAKTWMRQNDISNDELQQIFHITDGEINLIASEIPGKSTKEKTLNVYILSGAAKLLATGEPIFDDKFSRALCQQAGCYDPTNHAAYLKTKGNGLSGSKDKGWTLTAPGLKQSATLIKEMAR